MKILTSKDLSQNLTLPEMLRSAKADQLKIKNTPSAQDIERMRALAGAVFQPLRVHFGGPVFVSSGFRTPKLNTAVNGRPTNSQHNIGEAVDLDNDDLVARKVKNAPTNKQIFDFIRQNLPFDQLIWEFGDDKGPAWVHVSFRTTHSGRRQILTASHDRNNKTLYLPWKP